ncbi:MAG: N-acetylmuramoyl-L-alanine amidase [Chloroflexota bacterium]
MSTASSMSHDRNLPDEFDDYDYNEDTPGTGGSASSIFLEMMRQQASTQEPPAPARPDPQPYVWQPPAATPTEDVPAAPPHTLAEQDADPDIDSIPAPEGHDQVREQLRAERIRRRRTKRRMRVAGIGGGFLRSLFTVSITALITATIFTWWQGPEFLSADVRNDLSIALATATNQGIMVEATALPSTPNWLKRIGIISGHRGPENDPGAVCPDGLTEAEINLAVAQRVVRSLQTRGYTVDLLDEFDPRLNNYEGDALVSIHANTCRDYGELVTGFLIATADARAGSGNDQLLVECLAAYYEDSSQLQRRFGLTRDVTDYHVFREIHPRTPGAIVELGFMLADRDLLVNEPDLLASGLTDGILCYLEPEDPNILATLQAPTPAPPTPLPTIQADT